MLLLEWLVPLLIGAVGLTALARKIGVPYPAFLALGGAGLALLPSGPNFVLDPDLALALFVAPVLLDSAYDASLRDIRANWLSIILLVLAAVVLTTVAVACVARLMLPDLPWAAAIALGAIVAPPDATAAMAILRQVPLPFRIRIILEGESLLNDASALFIYRLAVGAVAAGAVHPGSIATSFVLVLPLSVALGVGVVPVTNWIVGRIENVPSSIIMQFSFTFGLWILAEKLQLSGVIVLVAYAVTIAQRGQRRLGARLRLPSFAVWETAVFALNVIAFVLIGLQLRPILEGMKGQRLAFSICFGLVVLVVCLLSRALWVTGYHFVKIRHLERRGRLPPGKTAGSSFKRSLVMSWCGMRGIVTLAAAFALPDGTGAEPAFPHRDLMLLAAFSVVLGTLVLQGLSLKVLLQWLALEDDDPTAREIGRARTELIRAACAEISDEEGPAADALRNEFQDVLRLAEQHPEGFAPAGTDIDELRLRTIAAGRQRLLQLRARGEIGGDAFARLEEELDQAEMNATTA